MAAYVCRFQAITFKFGESCFSHPLGSLRYASKKATGSCALTPCHKQASNRGPKKKDGDVVTNGTVLAIHYKIVFCPGLNVGFGKRGQIYAKVPGQVIVSCEKTNFDRQHNVVKKWYPNDGQAIYKKYYNVIPKPQHQRFKLIDRI